MNHLYHHHLTGDLPEPYEHDTWRGTPLYRDDVDIERGAYMLIIVIIAIASGIVGFGLGAWLL